MPLVMKNFSSWQFCHLWVSFVQGQDRERENRMCRLALARAVRHPVKWRHPPIQFYSGYLIGSRHWIRFCGCINDILAVNLSVMDDGVSEWKSGCALLTVIPTSLCALCANKGRDSVIFIQCNLKTRDWEEKLPDNQHELSPDCK